MLMVMLAFQLKAAVEKHVFLHYNMGPKYLGGFNVSRILGTVYI